MIRRGDWIMLQGNGSGGVYTSCKRWRSQGGFDYMGWCFGYWEFCISITNETVLRNEDTQSRTTSIYMRWSNCASEFLV